MVFKLILWWYLSTFYTLKTIGRTNLSEKPPTLIFSILGEAKPWKLTSWKQMKSVSVTRIYVTLKLSVFLLNMTIINLLLSHQKKDQTQQVWNRVSLTAVPTSCILLPKAPQPHPSRISSAP